MAKIKVEKFWTILVTVPCKTIFLTKSSSYRYTVGFRSLIYRISRSPSIYFKNLKWNLEKEILPKLQNSDPISPIYWGRLRQKEIFRTFFSDVDFFPLRVLTTMLITQCWSTYVRRMESHPHLALAYFLNILILLLHLF